MIWRGRILWPWRNRDPWPRLIRHRPPCTDPACQPCWNDALDDELWKGGYYAAERRDGER